MALLNATRTAQWPLLAEFTFNFDDTIRDIAGVEKDFGKTEAHDVVCSAINLPEGAVVVGGEVVVEVQGVGPTVYTVSLGDSASATRYTQTPVDLKGAVGARTALTLTGFRTTENLRLTVNSTVAAATAGRATVRVMYVMPNRANETIPN